MSIRGNISINGSTRSLDEADAQWVAQQINGRRHDGQEICLRIELEAPVRLSFASPACRLSGGGGSRVLPALERTVIDLWHKHDLDQVDIEPGHVIAFLRQLESSF